LLLQTADRDSIFRLKLVIGGVKDQFGTIMSYVKPGIMLFSGANLTTECLGQPCGYPEGSANASDQVITMNQTAPLTATFRDSITVTP
jgi:hypothetical protein